MERGESVLRASRSLGTRALLLAEWPRSTRVFVHNFHRHQNKSPMSPKHGRNGPRIVDGVPSEMFIRASNRPLNSLQEEKTSSSFGKLLKSRTDQVPVRDFN